MGFLTNKKTGNVFKVNNNDGEILSSIGTPIHSTQQESKIRLITRQLERNQSVRESHEEKQRRKRLQQAEIDKKERQRKEQIHSIIDEIETRRRMLKQAKNDPKILDKLNEVNPRGGSLPRNFEKLQKEKLAEFFSEEQAKINSIIVSAKQDIQRATTTINENENLMLEKKRKIEELRKSESNIPEINHENTRMLNDLVRQVADLENINKEFHDDIERATNQIKMSETSLDKLRSVKKDSAFGTLSDIPDGDKPTLPKETVEARERASDSYDKLKTGKGTSMIFPEGFMNQRKVRNPITGETYYTHKLPSNKRFAGFDTKGKPVFVESDETDTHNSHTMVSNEPRTERTEYRETEEYDNQTQGQQLRIIPGLSKGVE